MPKNALMRKCCLIHLKTSENAVKTQIWIAISVYVLVTIVCKRLRLDSSLYQILQILSVIPFEKTPISQALQRPTDSV